MVDVGQSRPVHQTHNGLGPQIAGHNFAPINYELLDPKTRVMVEKLAATAPDLAKAVEKAARDGIISPDAVDALNRAVEHLNEETVMAFRYAARHINEETAMSFEGVAEKFVEADKQLAERVREIDNATDSLRSMIMQVGSASDHQYEPANAVEWSFLRHTDKWWIGTLFICWSLAVTLIPAVILTRIHLGVYPVLVGAFSLLLALFLQFGRTRRS